MNQDVVPVEFLARQQSRILEDIKILRQEVAVLSKRHVQVLAGLEGLSNDMRKLPTELTLDAHLAQVEEKLDLSIRAVVLEVRAMLDERLGAAPSP